MDETSGSSTNIRALRVRVRVREGLGEQGPTPRFPTHEVTFTSRHHPHDVITPMTSLPGLGLGGCG